MQEHEPVTIVALTKTVWFWLIPAASGAVDWLNLMIRGVKPRKPWFEVVLSLVVHLATAIFVGTMSIFAAVWAGYNDPIVFGIAGGSGGFLGTRAIDIAAALVKMKTGVDVKVQP